MLVVSSSNFSATFVVMEIVSALMLNNLLVPKQKSQVFADVNKLLPPLLRSETEKLLYFTKLYVPQNDIIWVGGGEVPGQEWQGTHQRYC